MEKSYANANRKVLVLGFDAGTFDIIKPMIKKGNLPNFKKMMEEGSYGNLQSTFPPVTPPAWASFMTGKNPGKHGVYNFYYHSLDPSKDDENYFVNSHSIRANTIWEILSQKGLKNIVINLPVTYPLTNKMNGIIISGLLTPTNAKDFIYPGELYNEILRNVGQYRVDSHPSTQWSSMTVKERVKYYFKIEEERTNAALYLLEKHEWDFFMVMFSFTDKILHLIYHHLNLNQPESKELREYIYKTYEKADEILGKFLSAAGSNTTVFVVSDHGFGSMEKGFISNKWLADNGYMSLRKTTVSNFTELFQVKIKKMPVDKVLRKLRLKFLRHVIPYFIKEMPITIPRFQKRVSRSVVDWKTTIAYGTDYGIRINLKGREATGIIEPGEQYERVRDEIIKRLYELRDPETNEKLVDRVWKREEVYHGPYFENAPDLMYIMKGISYVQYDTYYFNQMFIRFEHGTHRMNGIFLMKGQEVKKGHEIDSANIIDVAPTILYSLGLPVPDDMDGRVLTESLRKDILDKTPVQYEKALPLLREQLDDRSIYTQEEEEEIKKGLQGLGYWG